MTLYFLVSAHPSLITVPLVRQFQEMDVFLKVNTAHGISNSRDKLRSLQIFSRAWRGLLCTTFVRDKRCTAGDRKAGGARLSSNS